MDRGEQRRGGEKEGDGPETEPRKEERAAATARCLWYGTGPRGTAGIPPCSGPRTALPRGGSPPSGAPHAYPDRTRNGPERSLCSTLCGGRVQRRVVARPAVTKPVATTRGGRAQGPPLHRNAFADERSGSLHTPPNHDGGGRASPVLLGTATPDPLRLRSGAPSGDWAGGGFAAAPEHGLGPHLVAGEIRGGERAGACLRPLIGRPLVFTLRTSGPRPGALGQLASSRAVRRRPPRISPAT